MGLECLVFSNVHIQGRRVIRLVSSLFIASALVTACSSRPGTSSQPLPTAVHETAMDISTLNGEVPLGELLPLQSVTTMLDTVDATGLRLVITQGTRKAGTRAPIHTHQYGGHTCVIAGEITDFIEGMKPMKYPTGTCYYMPPNTLMSAANIGSKDAVLIDTFNLPVGAPTITVREPGWTAQ